MSRRAPTSARGLAFTLVALLTLAGVSLALRFADLGSLGLPLALGIALMKALLVVVFFMELFAEKATARLAFAAGLTLFALMAILIVADVLTRSAPPLQAPPGNAHRYYGEAPDRPVGASRESAAGRS